MLQKNGCSKNKTLLFFKDNIISVFENYKHLLVAIGEQLKKMGHIKDEQEVVLCHKILITSKTTLQDSHLYYSYKSLTKKEVYVTQKFK